MAVLKHYKADLSLTCLLLFSACNKTGIQKAIPVDTNCDIKVPHTESENIKNDQEPDYTDFPAGTCKIIATGIFHSDEIIKNAQKAEWYGLFKDKNGYYTAPTLITIKSVFDEITGDTTGWEVSTQVNDLCVILIEKLPFIKSRRILEANLPKYPGGYGYKNTFKDSLRFSYMGTDYKIFEKGKSRIKDNTGGSDSKLIMAARKNGKYIEEVIVENFSKETLILFAGDIDDDNQIDLIINIAIDNNNHALTLLLSKTAEKDHLLKVAGSHSTKGC